jgi:hypothetical protein
MLIKVRLGKVNYLHIFLLFFSRTTSQNPGTWLARVLSREICRNFRKTKSSSARIPGQPHSIRLWLRQGKG